MKTSTDRILTTHVGSIPRPESVRTLLRARLGGQRIDEAELAARATEAVADVVRRQGEVGLDVVSDGEMSKTSFLGYTDDRLTGFVSTTASTDPSAALTPAAPGRGAWTAGESGARFASTTRSTCRARCRWPRRRRSARGPIAYKGQALLEKDLTTFKAALRGVSVAEAFVPAIAPAMVGRGQNRYYKTEEEYVFAIAEALRTEYRAIVDAGFILQIDDPGLGETWDMLIPAPPLEEYRKTQARNLEALNHALAGIPEDRVRYHLCWGSWQGPHLEDLSLRDVVDLVLRVKAQAYSIEAATPRHS